MKEIADTRFRKNKKTYASFLCRCGNKHIARVYSVKIGKTKSCGCYTAKFRTKHGRRNTTEYRIWQKMKRRCLVEKDKDFPNYGGRGITICKDWEESFEKFYRDMGDRPSKNHCMERVDNNKGYCKENCVWATFKEQANNRRSSRWITYNGETKTLSQWCEQFNIIPQTFLSRIQRGMSIGQALSKPVRKRN